MKRKFRQPRWRGLLPTSSEILGAVARLCDWSPRRSAKERTWRKFCHGEPIHGSTRREIVEEMAGSLVGKLGQIHDVHGAPLSQEVATQGLLGLIVGHALWWDLICKHIESALPVKPTVFTTTVALRLALVELVMRLSGLFLANDVKLRFPANLAERQVDASRLFLPYVLREVIKAAHITRLVLAEELGVTREAVDQWLDSKAIIPPERIDDIAEVIAEKMGIDPTHLGMGLRVVRQMSLALMPLADMVGKEEVGRLFLTGTRLLAVAQDTLPAHTSHLDAAARSEALGLLITLGGESPLGAVLRTAMLDKIPDEQWKRAIATPIGRWGEFLGDVSAMESVSARLRNFLTEQGFPCHEEDSEQLQRRMLLPRESSSNPYAQLFNVPHQERVRVSLVLYLEAFQALATRKQDAESLQSVGLLSEAFGMMGQYLEGEFKEIAEEYRWRCLSFYVVGCMGLSQDHLAKEERSGGLLWSGRIMKVLRALPPIPVEAKPSLKPLLEFLRLMKRAQEDLDAGRSPSVGPRDFSFLEELNHWDRSTATVPPL